MDRRGMTFVSGTAFHSLRRRISGRLGIQKTSEAVSFDQFDRDWPNCDKQRRPPISERRKSPQKLCDIYAGTAVLTRLKS